MASKPDPTKDPEFEKVVQAFLRTPPKPFTPKGEKPKKTARKAKAKRSR
jgi:hypothetical protein